VRPLRKDRAVFAVHFWCFEIAAEIAVGLQPDATGKQKSQQRDLANCKWRRHPRRSNATPHQWTAHDRWRTIRILETIEEAFVGLL
jgi:hypothetical protein